MNALTRRWHNRWHTSTVQALCVAAVAFEVGPAAADCAPPVPAIVWSHPAQGATGVPTNVDLWLQMSGWDGPPRVWLDDELVPSLALPYGYDLGELAPNTEYDLLIEPQSGEGNLQLRFTTGGGPASPEPGVAPGAVAPSQSSEYEATALCRAALNTQDCFDTGQNTYFAFTPSADALGWLIQSDAGFRPANLWPGVCGAPRLFGHDSASPCVTLHAIDAIGATYASERVCAGTVDSNDATPASQGVTGGADRTNDASCGLPGRPGSRQHRAPLSLLGLALVLSWRTGTRWRPRARP